MERDWDNGFALIQETEWLEDHFKRQSTCTCSQANPRSAPAAHREGWRSPHPSSPSSTSSSETTWQKSQEQWPFWWPHWANLIWSCNQLIAYSFALTGLCFITDSNRKDNRDNVNNSNLLFYKTVLTVGCCFSCSPERVVLERGDRVDRRVVVVVEALVQQLVHTLAVFNAVSYTRFLWNVLLMFDTWSAFCFSLLRWWTSLSHGYNPVYYVEVFLMFEVICWERNGLNSEIFSSVND